MNALTAWLAKQSVIPPLVVAAGGLSLFIYLSIRDHDARIRAEALSAQHLQALTDSLARQRKLTDSLATQYHADTVKLRVERTKFDTARVTVERFLHDTLVREVPVEVVRTVVQAADSTIRACSDALNTCQVRINAVQTTADLWMHKYQVLAQQKVGSRWYVPRGQVGGGCVLTQGKVACGPSLTIGWRLW